MSGPPRSAENVFAIEIARKMQLKPLGRAANFPKTLKQWESSIDKHINAGGAFELKAASRQHQFQNPSTAHYFDRYFEPWTHPVDGNDYTVELARFAVPTGQIAIVKKLFQWVSGDNCRADDWGNPFKGNPDIDDIIWHLRLDPYLGLQPARLVSLAPFLPGIPYADLPEIQYLWYVPQAAASDLNLVIPGGFMLRFIARIPSQQTALQAMGRLVGYWQATEYSVEAGFNARKGF